MQNIKENTPFCATITLSDGRKIDGIFSQVNGRVKSLRPVVQLHIIEDGKLMRREDINEFDDKELPVAEVINAREISRQKYETKKVVHDLSRAEVLSYAKLQSKMVNESNDAKAAEADYKALAKEQKELHEKLQGEITAITSSILFEREERQTDCPVLFDYESKLAYTINPVTGLCINVRELVGDERNPELFTADEVETPKEDGNIGEIIEQAEAEAEEPVFEDGATEAPEHFDMRINSADVDDSADFEIEEGDDD